MNRLFSRPLIPPFRRGPLPPEEFAAEVAAAEAAEWDQEQLAARVTARLGELLRHAYTHVPYYRDAWHATDYDVHAPVELAALQGLPILDKATLRSQYSRLFSQPLPPVSLAYTSATNSRTTVVVKSRRATALGLAAFRRFTREIGVPSNPVIVNLFPWSSPPHRRPFRHDRSTAWIDVGLGEYCRAVMAGKPIRADIVVAPALLLRELAHALGARLREGALAVVNCYERLDPTTRLLVESLTGLRIFDVYSASEMTTPIAFECAMHRGMHINDDYVVVEIVDDAGHPVKRGETGQVLVTDLLNLAMPLIRYRLGDIATVARMPCACGRRLSMLSSIDGRIGDTIRLVDGREILAKEIIDLLRASLGAEFCLVQEDPTRFTLLVDCCPHDPERLRSAIEEVLGGTIHLNVTVGRQSDDGPRLKRCHFISKLSRPLHVPAAVPPGGKE